MGFGKITVLCAKPALSVSSFFKSWFAEPQFGGIKHFADLRRV
jgi:hypothetical protein